MTFMSNHIPRTVDYPVVPASPQNGKSAPVARDQDQFFVYPQQRWTTGDEITFLRKMFAAGNILALRNYESLARARDWRGAGMAVDVDVVLAEAAQLLEALEGIMRLSKVGGGQK